MSRGAVASRLVGAWRYVGTTVGGVNKPRGNNPKGPARCRCRSLRTWSAGVPARDDWRRGQDRADRLHSYFGSYTLDEEAGTVTHHRHASVQPGDCGDLVRKYELIGDRLILSAPGAKLQVTWERIR